MIQYMTFSNWLETRRWWEIRLLRWLMGPWFDWMLELPKKVYELEARKRVAE